MAFQKIKVANPIVEMDGEIFIYSLRSDCFHGLSALIDHFADPFPCLSAHLTVLIASDSLVFYEQPRSSIR